jgi:integrase
LRLLRGKRRELGFFDTFFGKMASEALREHLKNPLRENLKKQKRDLIFSCSLRNINDFLSRISTRAGLDWYVRSHDLRRYFNTNMKLSGVNESLVEYWIGHSLGGSKGAYLVPPVEEQLKVYKQAEKRLEPSWD